jgi:NAD(P)-dependent dehydrogenase (short-subunit alcohol dehydrogenase family)
VKGLSGKVEMVTGCAGERGVGRAITRGLAADGADLVLTDVAPGGTRVVTTNTQRRET